MMFMCASSLHVCERCYGLARYDAGDRYKLPLPFPILLPRRSTDAIKYVGDRFDPHWTIRMCLSCRQDHISDLEEPLPQRIEKDVIDWDKLCQKYPCANQVPGMRPLHTRRNNFFILESDALTRMRQHYGGDIGMESFKTSTEAHDEKTEARIRKYQLLN